MFRKLSILIFVSFNALAIGAGVEPEQGVAPPIADKVVESMWSEGVITAILSGVALIIVPIATAYFKAKYAKRKNNADDLDIADV